MQYVMKHKARVFVGNIAVHGVSFNHFLGDVVII